MYDEALLAPRDLLVLGSANPLVAVHNCLQMVLVDSLSLDDLVDLDHRNCIFVAETGPIFQGNRVLDDLAGLGHSRSTC